MRMRGVVAAVALLMGSLLVLGATGRAADTVDGTGTLQVTVTDGGYAVTPVVAAGQYELTVDNLSGQAADLILVLVPDGWTAADVRDSFAAGNDLASAGAFPQSVMRSRAIPYVVFAGQAAAHGRGFANVNLLPGTWVVLSSSAGANSQFTSLTVVGEA